MCGFIRVFGAGRVGGIPDGVTVNNTEIVLSENSDYSGAKVYNIQGQSNYLEIYRLKTGTQYFITVCLLCFVLFYIVNISLP